jgi:hypothetical protein
MQMSIDYFSHKISTSLVIDGDLKKPEWLSANWSPRFIDMASGEEAMYNTQTALLWNETHLYIGFQAAEPNLQAHQTVRDSIIFLENDLEVLIDGGDCYYELEVNAANTIYEVLFIWRDAISKGGKFTQAGFEPFSAGFYTFGGDYDRNGPTFWNGTHPRGIRWAFTKFDLPGLETAVELHGTLNDSSSVDEGWNLEIAIPWASLQLLANGRSLPPDSGDIWRIFLGRFQKIEVEGKEVMPHPASALRSHGIYDTHLPEEWSQIAFVV